ncbi:MAG: prepilin-type N-terminal cleavage/methylation domain-containing protein [Planctomycetes bacterium]|nr:prepilin-type N-terminal cleavage/methylation domain-containing protein [Planctomycetota bacterium]
MRRSAFTLIELLVVIAILGLLMAVLLAVLSGSRQQAKTIRCRANLRDLVISLHNYEAECQSLPYGFDVTRKYKPPAGYQGEALFDTPGWWWFDFAQVVRYKSAQGPNLLYCPSSKLDDPKLDRDPLCGKYGINRSLCKTRTGMKPYTEDFVGAPLSIAGLRHPGSTLLLVDAGYGLICWWHAAAEPPVALEDLYIADTSYVPGLEINKDRNLWPGQTWDAIGGRHPNKTVNIGFADGHAELKPARDLLVEKGKDRGYNNMVLWQGQQVSSEAP